MCVCVCVCAEGYTLRLCSDSYQWECFDSLPVIHTYCILVVSGDMTACVHS